MRPSFHCSPGAAAGFQPTPRSMSANENSHLSASRSRATLGAVFPSWGERPAIMGILNATPDSFAGDGLANDLEGLLARGRAQRAEGAAIVDVGGESTRPGATPVPEHEEIARVLPLVERLARTIDVPISIDTSKPAVAEAALRAGARIVNDVSGVRDPRLAEAAARHGAWLVVMDNGWTRPTAPRESIVETVCAELARARDVALRAGVPRERIVVDPGLGFGKSAVESLALLAATAEIRSRLRPHLLLCGPSRKRFTGEPLGLGAGERLESTLGAVALAAFLGADMIRVHDVRESVRAAWLGAASAKAGGRGPRLAYVGLGANLGDARSTLRRAVDELARAGRVWGVSGLWETAPREVLDQPSFLNAAVAVELPDGRVGEVVARLKRIEDDLGRSPGPRYGPRAIDLDLLIFDRGAEERDGDVIVPHVRLVERRFALAPLAELAPDLVEPRTGRGVSELLDAVADQRARRVEGPEWWTASF